MSTRRPTILELATPAPAEARSAAATAEARKAGAPRSAAERVAALNWPQLTASLDGHGFAVVPGLLAPGECAALAASYGDGELFRSRVVMSRHGFGSGEYQYFKYPLPELVQQLRAALYPPLSELANAWAERLGEERRFPAELSELLAACSEAGQSRPTPLLLQYGPDDYNCLHQDVYGEQVFPIQLAALLSEPGADFDGGEFVLVEQRPRMQSRVEVVPLRRGDAVLFAVRHRPRLGTRGYHRVQLRHGVSRIRRGARFTLGVIFHDAT
jgi:uncharacterized protein